MKRSLKILSLIALTLLLAGQSTFAQRPASSCQNVFANGVSALGLVEISPGVFGFGAQPTPTTLGNVPGMLMSIITSMSASGQGAQHFTLQHRFDSTDPARPGTFITEDRAVCGPAGSDPNVCRVNDVLSIVSGTGIFANADGKLHNNGIIDLAAQTVSFSLRGRMCGDGL
ncbi:MAG: hypothetical protein ABIR71_02100 [Chthoniobacterales bacterium]